MIKDSLNLLRGWPGNGEKLLLGMIHLKGDVIEDIYSRAIRECEIYSTGGFDGVVVENYFGSIEDVRYCLPRLKDKFPQLFVGVDIIWDNDKSFDLAVEHQLPFIQLDSLSGQLSPEDEPAFEKRIRWCQDKTSTVILGGVRLKNQPVLSGNSLEVDLQLAKKRGDGIIVTGVDTGVETELEKIKQFRKIIGDFPLIVGAGVNENNCAQQLSIADGAIIGSSLKQGGKATGDLEIDRVRRLVSVVRSLTGKENTND